MKIKDILKEKKEIMEITTVYNKRIKELDQSLLDFIKENEIYVPIEYLKKFKGKSLGYIVLVNEEGKEFNYSSGEIMEVDEKGNFYFSDYEQGIIEYNEKDGCYHWHYHFSDTNLGKMVGIRELQRADSNNFEISQEKLLEKYIQEDIPIKKEEEEQNIEIKDCYK